MNNNYKSSEIYVSSEGLYWNGIAVTIAIALLVCFFKGFLNYQLWMILSFIVLPAVTGISYAIYKTIKRHKLKKAVCNSSAIQLRNDALMSLTGGCRVKN